MLWTRSYYIKLRERLAEEFGAVSFSPINVSRCRRIGPESSSSSMNIVVTPVFFSPLTMAQLAGAAPR